MGTLSAIWSSPHDEDDRRYDAAQMELEQAGQAIDAELREAGGRREAALLLYAELEALEEDLPPSFD